MIYNRATLKKFTAPTTAVRYGLGHVTTALALGCTHGYLLYLVALLPLSLFFRFVVLVTVHLYDPL
jgi:hypothetical protein